MAMALAYGGARVLIIDADMRRPGLHRPLRLTNDRGLSQVLIGQARVRDVIQRTVDPNLLAITAGTNAAQPFRAAVVGADEDAADEPLARTVRLDHHRHAAGARRHRRGDPRAAGRRASSSSIGAEMTRRRLAERALETILQQPPEMVAVVLNKVDFARNKYHYSRYYGEQYKNYYAEAASSAVLTSARRAKLSLCGSHW